MDSHSPEQAPVTETPAPKQRRRVWKFWGTVLWGLFVFAAMFLGQVALIAYM